MYENNSRYPFEAFITNLGEYTEGRFNGKWVGFPLTAEEMQHVLESIDIGKERDGVNTLSRILKIMSEHRALAILPGSIRL